MRLPNGGILTMYALHGSPWLGLSGLALRRHGRSGL